MLHIPSPSHMVIPGCTVTCRSKAIVSYSIFQRDILPEWEDAKNADGHTLTTRVHGSRKELDYLWNMLTCDCARGHLSDHVNGVQFSKRVEHKQPIMKIDLWLPSTSDVGFVTSSLPMLQFVPTRRKL